MCCAAFSWLVFVVLVWMGEVVNLGAFWGLGV